VASRVADLQFETDAGLVRAKRLLEAHPILAFRRSDGITVVAVKHPQDRSTAPDGTTIEVVAHVLGAYA
jgi:hypothetical protein